jgi:hypothetical protein
MKNIDPWQIVSLILALIILFLVFYCLVPIRAPLGRLYL